MAARDDTDRSTVIATAEWSIEADRWDPAAEHKAWLYQTQRGAFFLVDRVETSRQKADGDWVQIDRYEFTPFTRERAQAWAMGLDDMSGIEVALIAEGVFDDPPEAEAEAEDVATLPVRLPPALRKQVDVLAAADDVSVNTVIIRCLESCIAGRRAKLEVVEG